MYIQDTELLSYVQFNFNDLDIGEARSLGKKGNYSKYCIEGDIARTKNDYGLSQFDGRVEITILGISEEYSPQCTSLRRGTASCSKAEKERRENYEQNDFPRIFHQKYGYMSQSKIYWMSNSELIRSGSPGRFQIRQRV